MFSPTLIFEERSPSMIHTKKNKKRRSHLLHDRIISPFFLALTLASIFFSGTAWADGPFIPAEQIVCPDRNKAETGSIADEYALARAYDKGHCGTAVNQLLALQWYKRAAEHGSMLAQYWLGEIYFSGSSNNGTPDYPEAKKWFLMAAQQDQGLAQLRLAYLYAEKHYEGVKSDYKEAEKWFTKAAEQNAGDAQFRLGNFYHNYKNPRDYKKAAEWLTRAAKGGNSLAMFDIAQMLKEGQGIPKNHDQSLAWMKKAATQGMLPAQMMLSEMYASGDGVPKDPLQSLAWTLKVAESPSSIPKWLNKAGDIFFKGWETIPKNYPRALTLYQRAAAKRDPHAQSRLGQMYLKGLGVKADLAKAREYLSMAADSGDKEAKQLLADMK
jgi:TPR repeat protein